MLIQQLRIEYQENPICIDTTVPRFFWRTDKPQTAYRIRVGSSQGGAELWDSGRVESGETVGIEYAGKPLASRDRGFVSLACWCGEEYAETEGVFEIGLLSESDWKGRWVSTNANFTGSSLRIRKNFRLDKPVERARVYLCGLGYHELYLNGRKITDHVLAPSQTDYEKRIPYSCYDVTDALILGENAIGVLLGHGWRGKRELNLELFVYYEDGNVYEDFTMNGCGWWMKEGEICRDSVYGGEEYDARLEEETDWTTAAYLPDWKDGWLFTFLVNAPETPKRADSVEPIRVTGRYPAQSARRIEEETVYDFGQNLSGWARIRVKGERGAKIILRFAEDLKEDGSINQANLRSAANTDTYTLAGREEEEYAPHFTYHGFRYASVRTEGKAEVLEITAEHVHTDVRTTGGFECSDESLNRLHKIAVMTELNNLHSIMTDCPQRDERLGWLNDLSSRIYQNIRNFGLERLIPKAVADMSDTQVNGQIADTAPFVGGTRPADPVCASYLLFGVFAYRYYGDIRLVREEYQNFRAWTEFLLTRQKDFVMDYTYYGDWVWPGCYSDGGADGIFMSSAYLYWHLELMSELAEIAGQREDFMRYVSLAAKSKEAFNRRYYDSEKKCYNRGTQTENALPLSLGIAPESDRGALAARVAADILGKGKHLSCGNQGYRHLFYALSDAGYDELLMEVLKNPEYPGWGYMLACGATTVWERWEKEMQIEMHSFDHPMFGSYDGYFYDFLGGISVEKGSFAANRLRIHPAMTNLAYVKCYFDTPRGRVVCNTSRTETGHLCEIEIPVGAVAKLELREKILRVNGTPDIPAELLPGQYLVETKK